MRALVLPTVLLALLTSCASASTLLRSPTRPVRAVAIQEHGGARSSCLIVFLPGFGDDASTYLEHGFPQHMMASGIQCDSVLPNLHVRYYTEGDATVAQILNEDVLAPAQARGYEHIWLVAISMGGLGASLLAEAHPDAIEGVIYLSPYLGEEGVIRSIQDAGGLGEWRAPERVGPVTRANYTESIWAFFQRAADDTAGTPELYLGWADGEPLSPAAEMLAETLPEGHTAHIEGGHTWTTWQPLFAELLARAHPPLAR
jgi:pimeloyl-ACP methyl ester carboxylesterase